MDMESDSSMHVADGGQSVSPNQAASPLATNALYQKERASRHSDISREDVITPEAALAELEAGNDRFADGRRSRTLMATQEPILRETLSKGQSPFAVIVTCSDSRVMDNLIFDQEMGRIFTVRLAGNAPGDMGMASIEYAVDYLGCKIVVIMGHTMCGAIGAVADALGEPLPGHMYAFQEHTAGLLEAVIKAPNETDADYKGRLAQENAKRQAQIIYDKSEIIREFVDTRDIWLLPAMYDLGTGKVTFFDAVETKPHKIVHHKH